MKKQYFVTKEGLRGLQDELAEMLSRRTEITEKLQIARDYGDLAENAEYHNARDEQSTVEARIAELQNIITNAEIIKKGHSESVRLGCVVKLTSNKGHERTYTMVGSVEANPLDGKISDESPLGQELIGRREGDTITLDTNGDGQIDYTIISIG